MNFSSIFARKQTSLFQQSLSPTVDDVATFIKNLDPNKAYGLVISMKVCDKSIWKPLDLIFQSCIKHGEIPTESKKANFVLVNKKVTNRFYKNYRPVYLLPICGNTFERLMCNSLRDYFIENKLISSSHSGFKPGNSCINQLLSSIHVIYYF